MENSEENGAEKPVKSTPKKPHAFKGMILDGNAYIAVKDEHYFRICERCDVEGTGLCGNGTLGTKLCNAFTMHFDIPVRFRFSQQLTDAISELK